MRDYKIYNVSGKELRFLASDTTLKERSNCCWEIVKRSDYNEKIEKNQIEEADNCID